MYDELIKNLRICSRCDFGQDCNGCTQDRDDRFCCDILLHNAADAIEDLENRLNLWRQDKIRRWIPVTERLPEENGFYLCLYKHKHPGGVAIDEGLSIVQMYKGKWNLNEIYAVSHWMQLPQPPESEDN